jgi:hypothetical protein
MSIALREGVQRLEVTLRVTLAVLAVGSGAMETPKEKLYSFKKDELLTLKLATDVGGKAVAESAKKKG